ncbi:hypothetical protein GCM10010300_04690 [Streptomyces olivaceoviridis]|uniref:hypothetical protein n=1 Tax=Streptomyces olivaceoviridis TaxID=1921 RepID=UPI0016793C8A|nr:hypothetical protein [Streptomyces olivaceoviridis]GGY64565.1 hypothetical protein GCM10010300_04690 [Streptomyces olivaceoviridis]
MHHSNEERYEEEPEPVPIWQRIRSWRLHQHLARGAAYGAGSGAVSLLLVWLQSRY